MVGKARPMSTQNRNRCLLVLLVVLISHASLTLHVNSHVAAEQRTCDLCTHYSNFEYASPPSTADVFPRTLDAPEPLRVAALLPAARPTDRRPRGPPLSA